MEEISAGRVFQNEWDLTGKGAREARHGDSGKTRTPEEACYPKAGMGGE